MVRCSSNSLSRCTEPLDTYPADSSHSELARSPAKAQPRMKVNYIGEMRVITFKVIVKRQMNSEFFLHFLAHPILQTSLSSSGFKPCGVILSDLPFSIPMSANMDNLVFCTLATISGFGILGIHKQRTHTFCILP